MPTADIAHRHNREPHPAAGLAAPEDRATLLRRALPSARAAVVVAVVLTLWAALDLVEPEIAVEACAILLVVAAAFYAVLRSGVNFRFVEPSLITGQVAALFLFLAYLSYRTAQFNAIVMLLYPAVMLVGMLHIHPTRLAGLAVLAVVSHALAIALTTSGKPEVDVAAIAVHLVTLAAVLGLFVYSAGYVGRLRTQLAQATRDLHAEHERAAAKASRDELTGAYNKGFLMEALAREISRAERLDKPLCIARIDIDHFGDINTVFGRAAGDALLARFTAVVQGVARNVDIFGRIGATEFLLLMPDTDLAHAAIGAQRLRTAVQQAAVPELPAGARMTCTIGLACHNNKDAPQVVLGRAEGGLNYAKAAGRNRVMAIGA